MYSVKGGSWLACDGINPVYLMDRGACIAGKPALTVKPLCLCLLPSGRCLGGCEI